MKVVLFRQHGDPEVLEYADFPTSEPKSGEALIRLHAVALNRVDVMVPNGWPGLKLELPHINGADGAGEIVALGSPMSTLEDFSEVMDLIVAGKLKPVLDTTFSLREAGRAQERLWNHEHFGKITLDIH